jgi:PH domain
MSREAILARLARDGRTSASEISVPTSIVSVPSSSENFDDVGSASTPVTPVTPKHPLRSLTTVKHEGWLLKLSSKEMTQRWQRRYFLLDSERFCYFAKKACLNETPRKVIFLNKIADVRSSGGSTRFEVRTTNGTQHFFEANTEVEADLWISMLEQAVNDARKDGNFPDEEPSEADDAISMDSVSEVEFKKSDFIKMFVSNSKNGPSPIPESPPHSPSPADQVIPEEDIIDPKQLAHLDDLFNEWFGFLSKPHAIKTSLVIHACDRMSQDLKKETSTMNENLSELIKFEYYYRMHQKVSDWLDKRTANYTDLPALIEWIMRQIPESELDKNVTNSKILIRLARQVAGELRLSVIESLHADTEQGSSSSVTSVSGLQKLFKLLHEWPIKFPVSSMLLREIVSDCIIVTLSTHNRSISKTLSSLSDHLHKSKTFTLSKLFTTKRRSSASSPLGKNSVIQSHDLIPLAEEPLSLYMFCKSEQIKLMGMDMHMLETCLLENAANFKEICQNICDLCAHFFFWHSFKPELVKCFSARNSDPLDFLMEKKEKFEKTLCFMTESLRLMLEDALLKIVERSYLVSLAKKRPVNAEDKLRQDVARMPKQRGFDLAIALIQGKDTHTAEEMEYYLGEKYGKKVVKGLAKIVSTVTAAATAAAGVDDGSDSSS